MALDISEVRVDLYPFMDLKDLSQMANLISGEFNGHEMKYNDVR